MSALLKVKAAVMPSQWNVKGASKEELEDAKKKRRAEQPKVYRARHKKKRTQTLTGQVRQLCRLTIRSRNASLRVVLCFMLSGKVVPATRIVGIVCFSSRVSTTVGRGVHFRSNHP